MEVAGAQKGCVTRRQILRLGFSPDILDGWLAKGWLLSAHRGVHAVGRLPRTHEERWWACVLACGDGAKVSAGTSAAAHALLRPHHRIHVTTPAKRARPGIATHARHLTGVQSGRDERRDAALRALGCRVVRVPDDRAAEAPALLARAVAA